MIKQLKNELRSYQNPVKAKVLQNFFKTGPGEYGEGDKFLGIVVPTLRKLSKKYITLSLSELQTIIDSPWHEERLLGLLILVTQYQKSKDQQEQKKRYQFYLKNQKFINNWDLVDLTAHHIVGHYLFDKDRDVLLKWSKDKNLWRRRISIISTWYFIRHEQFNETFSVANNLIQDGEDLIHKAVGWMLREVGKRDLSAEEKFLKSCYKTMPRTMLRYAIERFPERKRQSYLKGTIR